MRQVIKHRDIRLLNMIRRTDPEILEILFPSLKYRAGHELASFYIFWYLGSVNSAGSLGKNDEP